MLTIQELEKRAKKDRPDPQKNPNEYERWKYARKMLGWSWRIAETKGRTKKEVA